MCPEGKGDVVITAYSKGKWGSGYCVLENGGSGYCVQIFGNRNWYMNIYE